MLTSKKTVQYTEFHNMRTSTTIWKHFLRATDGQSAKCKICKKILKTAGGATTGLHTHLRAVHSNVIEVEAENCEIDITPGKSKENHPTAAKTETKKRKLMTDFFSSKSDSDTMEVVISRMAALDGCTFRFLAESKDLRKLFKTSGFEVPKSPKTIAKIVFDHAEEVKAETKSQILELKTAGYRFSLSLDEWTSLRNKRYMNINLHSDGFGGFNFKNLGLVKITGSLPALTAFNMLRDHLETFGISLDEDVVSQTTDGASVMVKMGTYCKGHHQLCLAHGVQLAVIDSLYKTPKDDGSRTSTNVAPATCDDSVSDTESDDDERSVAIEGGLEVETPTAHSDPSVYKEVIEKCRCVVKLIRKSPLKSDNLREYVLREHGKDLQLLLDCRTRWSSMSDMIGSFLKIKNCVLKVLIDWKSEISFSEDDIKTLTEIHQSLHVIKLAVLSMCRRDATLYSADTTLRFTLKKLDEQKTYLSSKLASNLRCRIQQRRLLLASVLHYLHDAEGYFSQADDATFPKPSGDEISEMITALLRQLKYQKVSQSNENDRHTDVSLSSNDDEITIQEQLENELKKCRTVARKSEQQSQTTNFDLAGFVKVEKAMYDNGGVRGVYLSEAYRYILCVLPTSVESERVFSCAGYFCNKLRSSLSDKMLDALIFLRTHFQEKK